jgi:hypothetical protein
VKQSKVPLARRAFTIAELCERNGLTPDIIRRLENEGRAPAVAVLARNARIVSLEEEQAWLQRLGAVKPRPEAPPALERTAFTVDEFCWRNGISLALYYSLQKQGRGPAIARLARNLHSISAEEELAWPARPGRRAKKPPVRRPSAQRRTCTSGLPEPTFTVDCGNGLQLVWRLREPIILPPASDPARAKAIEDIEGRNKTLLATMGAEAGTQNIDRILRLPGTTNLPN